MKAVLLKVQYTKKKKTATIKIYYFALFFKLE